MRLRLYSLVPMITGALALSACAFSPQDTFRNLGIDAIQRELDNVGVTVDATREQAECMFNDLQRQGVSVDQLPELLNEAASGNTENVSKIREQVRSAAATCGLIDNETATVEPTPASR